VLPAAPTKSIAYLYGRLQYQPYLQIDFPPKKIKLPTRAKALLQVKGLAVAIKNVKINNE